MIKGSTHWSKPQISAIKHIAFLHCQSHLYDKWTSISFTVFKWNKIERTRGINAPLSPENATRVEDTYCSISF